MLARSVVVKTSAARSLLFAAAVAAACAACDDSGVGAYADDGVVLQDASADGAVDAGWPEVIGETDDGRIELVDVEEPDALDVSELNDTPGDSSPELDAVAPDADTSDVGDTPVPLGIVLSGRMLYEDRTFDRDGFTGALVLLPARGVRVQLLYPDDTVLAEVDTDAEGMWSLETVATVQPEATIAVRALAEARYGASRTASVDRAASAIYALRREIGPGTEDVTAHDIELIARADTALGGAFNIVDVIWGAWDVMPDLAALPSPRLTVAWQPGVPYACGSCYFNNRISLGGAVADPDEYDDDIVLHEFAHFFVAHFGRDDSPGGPHRDRVVEPRLAYGEGLAYFLAGLFSDRDFIVDNFEGSRRLVDMEAVSVDGGSNADMRGTSDGTWFGNLREEIVAGVLWDAYDEASDAELFDTLSLGRERSLAIVRRMRTDPLEDVGARGTDLADWLLAAACDRESVAVEPLSACTSELGFPWEPLDVVCAGKGDGSTLDWPDTDVLLQPLAGARLVLDRGQSVLELPSAE